MPKKLAIPAYSIIQAYVEFFFVSNESQVVKNLSTVIYPFYWGFFDFINQYKNSFLIRIFDFNNQ